MVEFGFETTSDAAVAALSSYITGRTVVITGVTPGGLGLETARAIATQSPKLVILAGRSQTKLDEAQEVVRKSAPATPTRQLVLDLGSFTQVRKAAAEVNNWDDVPVVDIVINNAGIMARPFQLTEDGVESQFQTNHLSHFLFTQLIMGKILAAGDGARVVNLSSNAYDAGGGVRWDDWNFQNGAAYDRWVSYGQSKTANILYSMALAQKYKDKGLRSYSVHPGGIWTNLGLHATDDLKAGGYMDEDGNTINKRIVWKTLAQGASTSIIAAFDPSIAEQSGAYLADCKVEDTPYDFVKDVENPEKLWRLSERLVGQKFDV